MGAIAEVTLKLTRITNNFIDKSYGLNEKLALSRDFDAESNYNSGGLGEYKVGTC